MFLSKTLTSGLVFALSFAMVEVPFTQNAQAAMISTSQAVANLSRQHNLEKVNTFLTRQDVQIELIKRGVTPQEAKQRIASLSDFELQKIAGNIETAPAGAEPVLVIGLTTILIIVLIVLLLRH